MSLASLEADLGYTQQPNPPTRAAVEDLHAKVQSSQNERIITRENPYYRAPFTTDATKVAPSVSHSAGMGASSLTNHRLLASESDVEVLQSKANAARRAMENQSKRLQEILAQV